MAMTQAEFRLRRRQLMLHDGVAFLILTTATGILFAVTLLLFRSFSTHRADLAVRYSERGRIALAESRPKDAIAALRTSLIYAPSERSTEFLLAQALGADGRLEESRNYFLNLWDSQPGDGFINLQLARLSRQSKQKQQAIDYYRASIYGSWYGSGDTRRREVRLELADYLLTVKDTAAAQAELLIAASNAPENPSLQIDLGDRLLRADDPAEALNQYRKAIAESSRNPIAYEKAGLLAFQMGNYLQARDWLERALRESAGAPGSAADPEGDTATLLKKVERILTLDPNRAANRADRITRLMDSRIIAQRRFEACQKQNPSPALQALATRWTATNRTVTRAALNRDASAEETLTALISDSETLTAQLCGVPQGDDDLLLLLAKRGH